MPTSHTRRHPRLLELVATALSVTAALSFATPTAARDRSGSALRPSLAIDVRRPESVDPQSTGLRTEADRIMRLGAEEFSALRVAPTRPTGYDWTTDGCTLTPRSWATTFLSACRLHDFGYRNYGRGLFLGHDERTRRWIDRRFRTEMLRLCAGARRGLYARSSCRTEAITMYLVVRGGNYWGA